MSKRLRAWMLAFATFGLLSAGAAPAADTGDTPLVDTAWLAQRLGRDDIVLIDTSPPPMYAAGHIPGAISVDVFGHAARDRSPADMEQRFRAMGISAGKRVVIYDQGATYMATRLFYDLYRHGFPASDMHVLNGGMAKWQAAGGAVTKQPTPAPTAGSFRVAMLKDDVRTGLSEFLSASGDPARHALVEALEPSYHFGETKFFDRAGHVPRAIMWPSGDFFNADKTFKSPAEIDRMRAHLGIRDDQQIHSYCGGGGAAAVPFFALRFLLKNPRVKMFPGSQMEWLQDERGLPFWTYDAPYLLRDMQWLNGWNSRMLRAYGATRMNVVDVRSPEAYKLGHVPYALNLPASLFRQHLAQPAQLAEILATAGVEQSQEAVIVADGGLAPDTALAFLMLERLGQSRVSLLLDSVDEWGLRGLPLTKEATVVGARRTPQDLVVPAASPRTLATPESRPASYPTVYLSSGRNAASQAAGGPVVHLPYTELLNADGTPKPAKDLWNLLAKAGVPRYARIVCIADDPGEAAVSYFILKLMGFSDVQVRLG